MYPNVKRAHIVPRCHLAQFADGGGKLAVHILGRPKDLLRSIDKVGTRHRYYRRTRPDGTPVDDIEWTLAQTEARAAPILREIRERWPLSGEDKASLATLFAFQILRGPRWMEWRTDATRRFFREQRQGASDDEADALDQTERHLLSDTQRLLHMVRLAPRVTTVTGSMYWTLVQFDSPVVAMSDHPVVLWGPRNARTPKPTPINVGVLESLEIRVPVSPSSALVMSWADLPDESEPVVAGHRHHAASLNAFTVVEAEIQWFHRPGRCPPIATGRLLPLSPEFVDRYTMDAAAHSERRQAASDFLQPLIGSDDLSGDVTIFRLEEGQ